MNDLKIVKLSIAKICHELANYLSILKFLQEDLEASHPELEAISLNIDLLVEVMDFFRNVYSSTSAPGTLQATFRRFLDLKKISLKGRMPELDRDMEVAVCGIAYVIAKNCKSGDVIEVFPEGQKVSLYALDRMISPELVSAINAEPEPNIFNIFIQFIKQVSAAKFKVVENGPSLRISIWK